jgi:hypothetical protein
MEVTGKRISALADQQSHSEEQATGGRQRVTGNGEQVSGTPDPEASETSQGIPRPPDIPHADYSDSRCRLQQSADYPETPSGRGSKVPITAKSSSGDRHKVFKGRSAQSLEAEIRTPSRRGSKVPITAKCRLQQSLQVEIGTKSSSGDRHKVLRRKTAPHGDGAVGVALQERGPNPESRRRTRKPEAKSAELESRTRNPVSQASLPLSRADILAPAREKLRELLEKALDDPFSDAYTMLEIICLHHLIEAELKTREMDVMEVLRARSQGKQLAVRAAQSEAHTKHLATQTEKVRLQNRMLKHDLRQIRKELRQAEEAKSGGRPFDYERTLNQISAVIGLRGPEKFRYEEQTSQAS